MRCFLAIELPSAIRDRLRDLQKKIGSLGRAVRWTRVENIHLTLKFLGEVPDDKVPEICDAAVEVAAGFESFDLEIGGTGCFPPGGAARIVWVGMPNPPQMLLDCQRVCEESYAKLGFKKENRPFKPHLTIGRVKNFSASADIRAAVDQMQEFTAGRFTVDELVMFQSILKPQGPTYIPLLHAPLG
ncbi:MAG: RNA 2',3'-cyclic phosphodiesterase [Planctomycetota bacterium]|nr:MAG: RNA 2',3'-cyclic phosphodiesterase [Planctomycetota bacterium]